MPQSPDPTAYRTVKAEEAVRLARLAQRQNDTGAKGSLPRLSRVVVERRSLWRRLLSGTAA